MRLKTFTAPTMGEAMQQVRDELGPDAAIVTTDTDETGSVRVVAALEPADPPRSPPPQAPRGGLEWPPPRLRQAASAGGAKPNGSNPAVAEALVFHGVPDAVVRRLADGAPGIDARGAGAQAALAVALRANFHFAELGEQDDDRPLLLAGPPGVGKTLAIAKLAARAVLASVPVRLITTDTASAGAVEQLTAFARPLKLDVETADGPATLAAACRKLRRDAITLIDTQGCNPYDGVELAGLGALIAASKARPMLVLGAGGDVREAAEMAGLFARVGCTHLLVTRLDLARRFGGIVTAALAGLALTGSGASPIVAHGLQPLTPESLARLLVADGGRSAGARSPEPVS